MKKKAAMLCLIGALAWNACTAFAAEGTREIPATFRNIKIIVDGKELSAGTGAIFYRGTAYVPIRAVSEAVGRDVSWDRDTNTAMLDTPPPMIIVNPGAEGRTDFEMSAMPSGKEERTAVLQVTVNRDTAMPPYTLYYYGLSDVSVTLDGQTFPLAQALQEGLLSPNDILRKGWQDAEASKIEGGMHWSGRYWSYLYEGYRIIKYRQTGGSHDFYITVPGADINLLHQFDDDFSKFLSVQDILDYYKSYAAVTEMPNRYPIFYEGQKMIFRFDGDDPALVKEKKEAIRQLAEICGVD